MNQVVHSILLRDRQLRVLEETSSILVWHSVLVEDVESDNSDLVDSAAEILERAIGSASSRRERRHERKEH